MKCTTGDLPEEWQFRVNTQIVVLKKEKDPTTKMFDDDEWLRSLTEAQEISQRIVSRTTRVKPTLKKVHPIQMAEFLRQCVSRRLLETSKLSQQQCDNSVLAPREGLKHFSIFHQLIFDEWASGTFDTPLARIKVVEQLCVGMIEWVQCETWHVPFSQKHAAVAGWRHRALAFVGQEGVQPMPKTAAQSKDTLIALWNAVQLWEWLRLKPLELSAGSARATHYTRGACRINNAI